jgi:hypothetical protein
MKNIIALLICFFFGILAVWAEDPTSPVESQLQSEIFLNDYSGTYKWSFSGKVKYKLDPTAKSGSMSYPFPGIDVGDKKGVYILQPQWFQTRAEDILKFYRENHGKESLYDEKNPQDLWKAFACRAFLNELSANLKPDGSYADQAALEQAIVARYIHAALTYAHKYNNQLAAKKLPKFGSIVKVLQPLMASFTYSDAWIAISECFASSEKYIKGKEVFRDYFLNLSLMSVMRRQYQIPFSESRIAWSLLQMPDDIFIQYRRECLRRWLDLEQYRQSKMEEKIKVKEIPVELRGRESNNKLP